jgi:hypothetical protein
VRTGELVGAQPHLDDHVVTAAHDLESQGTDVDCGCLVGLNSTGDAGTPRGDHEHVRMSAPDRCDDVTDCIGGRLDGNCVEPTNAGAAQPFDDRTGARSLAEQEGGAATRPPERRALGDLDAHGWGQAQ